MRNAVSEIQFEIGSLFNNPDKPIHIKTIENRYGVNKNIFMASIGLEKYFIKLSDKNSNALTSKVAQYLSVPEQISHIETSTKHILIEKFIHGKLLTDIILETEKSNPSKSAIELENEKNNALKHLYESAKTKTTYSEIFQSQVNTLFFKRLFGDRFKQYYKNTNFEELFDKRIILNGKNYPSVNTILDNIKTRYYQLDKNKEIDVVLGHGDAHHQNILIEDYTNNIYFIDNEYNSFLSINMEIAKPYYIDLLGNYFFFFNKDLLKFFEVNKYQVSQDYIHINISIKKRPEQRIEIAKNKIEVFNKLLIECDDVFSVNDYLLLCHMLSRNPQTYDKDVLPIFLGYINIINNLDIYKPGNLFDF